MKTKQGYPIEDLLDCLRPTFPQRCDPRKGFGAIFNGDKKEAAAVRGELILMLEEWIWTGFQADGSEMPGERNFAPKQNYDSPNFELHPAPKALKAMADYLGGNLMLIPEKSGELAYVISVIPDSAPNSKTSGFAVDIGSKGGFRYRPATRHQADPKSIAGGMFMQFYRSEWLFSLMQCRRCRKFAMPTSKPRKRLERGWNCPKCSHAAPNEAKRDDRRKELRRLTSEACARWDAMPQGRQRGERVVWLAGKVNENMPMGDHITRNTITRILKDIGKSSD
jgi:hypothetical protein